MNNLKSFFKKNSSKKVIVVQGLGFVGSVMSLVCANAIKGDYAIIGIDLPTDRGKQIIDDLNNGIFPLVADDPKIDQFYQYTISKGNFFATSDEKSIEKC
jgi:UDP-N-acetyl-D-mannosaminuronate dehydrogenase